MASQPSNAALASSGTHQAPTVVKIVIAGGFAVGKTTFIGSISDIDPLNTEAAMTEHSVGVDDAGGLTGRKTTTTVAMDFGRIALPGALWLYLFGTPGQDRFLFMWDDLVRGAIGAVVLVDTERLDQCFPAVDYFEGKGIPFVVCVNCFDGVARHKLEDVREALGIPAEVPMMYTDARERAATKQALIAVVQLAMQRLKSCSNATGGVGATLSGVIYVDGTALEQFFPGARFFNEWTGWAIPRLNDLVTTQVALTEMRHAAELLPRNVKRHAFEVMEQVRSRLAVTRLSDDTMAVSTYAASILTPFAALQLGVAVTHPDIDAVATYDPAMAKGAEIYGLAVVTPGLPRGWHNDSTRV